MSGYRRTIIYRVYGIWSTAKATAPEAVPLRATARKSRVLPSGNWEDVTVCYLTAKTQSWSSGAYVCLYCWPVVAFSGRIILPLKQWVPYTEFSREVNDCLLSIIRASGSTVARKYTDIGRAALYRGNGKVLVTSCITKIIFMSIEIFQLVGLVINYYFRKCRISYQFFLKVWIFYWSNSLVTHNSNIFSSLNKIKFFNKFISILFNIVMYLRYNEMNIKFNKIFGIGQ